MHGVSKIDLQFQNGDNSNDSNKNCNRIWRSKLCTKSKIQVLTVAQLELLLINNRKLKHIMMKILWACLLLLLMS